MKDKQESNREIQLREGCPKANETITSHKAKELQLHSLSADPKLKYALGDIIPVMVFVAEGSTAPDPVPAFSPIMFMNWVLGEGASRSMLLHEASGGKNEEVGCGFGCCGCDVGGLVWLDRSIA